MICNPNDIIIRNNTTWISQGLLLQLSPGLTDVYMRKARTQYKNSVKPSLRTRDILPDTGKSWRWAKINNAFYYAYDNIPNKSPNNYRSNLPEPKELRTLATASEETNPFEEHFKPFLNDHYKTYITAYGDCSKTQQVNLAKAAAVVEAAILYINTNNINMRKSAFFTELSRLVSKYDIAYIGHNARVIKGKIMAVLEGGEAITSVIVLPRGGNDNATRYNDEEIKSWILQLREMGRNYTNSFIIRKIKEMCELTGKPAPSDRWIGAIMQTRNVNYLTAQQRFGTSSRFAKPLQGYIPMQNALFAGDAWQVDGTRVNMVDHKNSYTDDMGNKITTRDFLYIVTVRDVHSGDILGYHFDVTEDRWAVFNALKMAVKTAGYLPYEIIFDKFPGHNTQEMMNYLGDLERWGVKITLSSDPNVKPQLERWFGTLQTVFMQESLYYYGQGIRSRRTYARRSEEYMKRVISFAKKNGWDWYAACKEATTIVEAYRNTAYSAWSRKHKNVDMSPAAIHEASEKPHVIELSAEDYWYLFGLKVELPVDGGGLIKKEIAGNTYYYRTYDYDIISKHSRVLVCYDLDDLSQVMLYSITDGPIKQFLGRCNEETLPQRYGPNADWGTIQKRRAEIRQLEDYKQQELEYRKAVGSDITTLVVPMMHNKATQERAESDFLRKEWKQSLPDDEGDDIEINTRNQY